MPQIGPPMHVSTSISMVPPPGKMLVSVVDFETVIDSVGRALQCAQQAERVSAAASTAFGMEARALIDVKHALELIKANHARQ